MEGALRDIDIAGQVVAGSQGLDPAIIRHVCSRFRILIVGPANAGKTTLIKKFCQSDEEAVVRNAQGQTVSSSTLNPSAQRGLHVINHEITYQSNPSFVFHDSMGFESGSTVESNIMLEFIHQRSGELSLADRLHAIWFCIPAGQDRVLGEPELELFKHNTFGMTVPVIVIFTKWDVQIQKANNLLRHQGRTRLQAKEEAPGYAETCFAPQLQDILHTPYPPRAIVYLRDMHKPEGNCNQLSRVTAEVLDDAAVKRFFISRQTVADKLAAEHAVRYDTRMLRDLGEKCSWFDREILSLKPSVLCFHSQVSSN
ncbi:hypothetical protein GLOTRDRAFT_42316 [Gloeophyllum trabeum ATCC 11539]|uniref:G domain-containing protein n=1 Tax=Gloeophyllum trabeum (strain ATCC 11539 / FP-39264 / Madison 617) TaxID=670483 RepID=S7Q6R7_GLOTA|nr:uncharacterized protein GLOTRDRAFT_42316 [Gloeophyllum trabeum ATCC 11539]EPQ55222.1 hypothetical protein GLOTRDRAFT_42316 [Gloeophyllum trabeum ATCC 11539]